ncbi:MAG: cupredoxin domain-containing protein [Candidatus Xenobia bacterium]
MLPIVAGQTVDFPNFDPIFHEVHSGSKGQQFELKEYSHETLPHVPFKPPGVVELFCGIQANMNAYILVLQNPFFSQPDWLPPSGVRPLRCLLTCLKHAPRAPQGLPWMSGPWRSSVLRTFRPDP